MNYSRILSYGFWYKRHFLRLVPGVNKLIFGQTVVNYEPSPTLAFAFDSKNKCKALISSYRRNDGRNALNTLFNSITEVSGYSNNYSQSTYNNIAGKTGHMTGFGLENSRSSRSLNSNQDSLFNSTNFNKNF